MRTPKYRIYIKHWGNSEDDGLVYPKEGNLHVYFSNYQLGGYKDAVFQQFTGLKDKNGKEVYEGDVICREAADLTYTVVYVEHYARFMARDADGDDSPLHLIAANSEVIGNTFENPELLK